MPPKKKQTPSNPIMGGKYNIGVIILAMTPLVKYESLLKLTKRTTTQIQALV